jgi:hypothetical protein
MAPGVNAWPPKVIGTRPRSLEDLLEQSALSSWQGMVTIAAWKRVRAPYWRNWVSHDPSVSPWWSYRSAVG